GNRAAYLVALDTALETRGRHPGRYGLLYRERALGQWPVVWAGPASGTRPPAAPYAGGLCCVGRGRGVSRLVKPGEFGFTILRWCADCGPHGAGEACPHVALASDEQERFHGRSDTPVLR